ncbi:MAG: YesL family protein [Clostridia bacterium]|nr:YesL family protein [Clostridia bacterium]
MRRWLDVNNPIMRFLTTVFDLMALSSMWLIFSVPIVTMGAASAALYHAVYHHVRKGEDYLWHSFWSAFKENLKRSTLCWLAALAVLALLIVDAVVLRGRYLNGEPFGWLYYVILVLLVLTLTWTIYLAAYAARFSGTAREVLRFSLLLFRIHPIKMLAVLALVVGGIALALTLPAFVILIPATVYWAATFPMESVFYQHLRPEDKERMEKEKEES